MPTFIEKLLLVGLNLCELAITDIKMLSNYFWSILIDTMQEMVMDGLHSLELARMDTNMLCKYFWTM